MAVFRSPSKQAASVMRELQGTILKSVRTVENYERGPGIQIISATLNG